VPEIHITDDAEADQLLSESPLALLIGMLLDQQVPMEWAFTGPKTIRERMDGELSAERICRADPDDLEAIFKGPPAVHRYPGSMAKRVQALCQHLLDEYEGRAEAVWEDADTGKELKKRLKALPGYGDQKARIFVALLGKQVGVQPDGWREAAGDYGLEGYRSVADITSPESLDEVREFKRAKKAEAKG
jgi:uncharacterized HhH-GPD family protein